MNRLLKETHDAARDAVAAYFRPLLLVLTAGASDRIRAYPALAETKPILGLLTKAICYNQGAMIEYAFLTEHKHQELREMLDLKTIRPDAIETVTIDLLNFMNRKYFEIVYQNFEFIREYFALTNTTTPRICLKGNFIVNSKETVVSIFRDQPVKYYYKDHINRNTGFLSIKESGRYFFENNIPEAVLERGYVNPRFKTEPIKADFGRTGSIDTVIRNWDRYWIEYKPSKRGDTSFYKSTLIVPLTLWNNDISSEFQAIMNLKLTEGEKIDRYIFGYLCFDHREIDYFNEERDSSLGYILADLLSLFAFTRMVYTDLSRTFSGAQKFLQENGIDLKFEKVGTHLPGIAERKLLEQWDTSERAGSKRNKLMSTDELLVEYARSSEEIIGAE